MSRIVASIVAVALCFAVGETLLCYKCDIGFFNLCVTSQMTCAANQQCFSGVGKAAQVINIKMKGCLDIGLCNQTSDVNFPSSSNTTIYKMTKTCCATDLCNSGPGVVSLSVLTLLVTSGITALMTTALV
ncbi:sperm acrosome membrane-associated protein 4-like [Denticeps clupeoides]|uniref:UPAR/Ly6 domain-containing protein n=1 Tax=Denticeps clupeoides TaxID=299321 RepID=A0AAY4BK93_9TELE|nr:sperm acrosome membrane-associated protein 4-like [Denticeps clupeoides]